MPFVYPKALELRGPREIPIPEFQTDVGGMEIARALYSTENTIGSFFAKESGLPGSYADESFNPVDYFTEDEKLDKQFFSNAALANNEAEINAVRRQSARERQNRQIIADGGALSFIFGIGIAGIDPVNMIPIGGAVAKTYKAGNSILSAAAVTGTIASSSAAIQEAALHSTQIERTYGESAINIGASALLGGVIGAGAAKIGRYIDDKGLKAIVNSMNVEPKIAQGDNPIFSSPIIDEVLAKDDFIKIKAGELLPESGSKISRGDRKTLEAEANLSRFEQGLIPDEYKVEFDEFLAANKEKYTTYVDIERNSIAAQAIDEGISPEELSAGAAKVADGVEVTGKVGKFLTKALGFDPLSRTITSINPATRRIANALAENPIAMDGGAMTAAESLAKLHDGKYATALQMHLDIYKNYRSNGGMLKRREFNEVVARAMRDDASNIPEALESARVWRDELYDPLKNEMINLNMLPEDVGVDTAVGYLNRSWNRRKIAAQLPLFVQKVSKWLEDEDARLFREAAEAAKGIKTAKPAEAKKLKDLIDKAEYKKGLDLDVDNYEDIARQIARRIQSSPDGRLPYDWKMGEGSSSGGQLGGTSLRGPLRSRTFKIPDNMVEEFLDNNIEDLGRRYLRQTAVDIELTRKFGDVDMKAEMAEVDNWYKLAIEKSKTEKERLQLQKKHDQDVKDIRDMRDRLRGVYGNVDSDNPWVRTGRFARNLNYLRLMGGVVASSVPDVARIIMAEGVVKTFSKGLFPLATNLKNFKVAAAEAKRYGVGVDALMGGRSQIIADVADYTMPNTAIERGVQALTDNFGRINLMDYWTAGVKQLHAVTMQNSVIDGLLKGKIDKRLKRLGIDDDNAQNIAEELKKHAEKVDGVWLSNAKSWDSPDLEQLWGAALRKESDRVIVVPGQEKPLFMSSEMGKTFFQFKSFMFSSTQRMTIAALQGQDHNAVAGVLMLTSLGMMSYSFKQWDGGREISDDPLELIIEGIDRSAVLGGIMEINNTVEKLSTNNFGFRPMLGVESPAARFASRSMSENMLGPTFGSLLDTSLRVANAGASGDEWTGADTRAMRRLLPFQNLSIIRQGLDEIEKQIGDL